jgi:hypothetical protein
VEIGEGLLFDGVQGGGGDKTVGEGLQGAMVVPAGAAPAPLGRENPAVPGTEAAAADAAFFFVIKCTFHGYLLLRFEV